jgi:hypothetical protein
MSEFDPELIVMQAASTEPDARMIETLMANILRMAHAENSAMRIGSAEQMFGWNFYIMSVDKAVDVRGSSLEQKFVGWLNQLAKASGADDRIHFNLLSNLKSSRYGLF